MDRSGDGLTLFLDRLTSRSVLNEEEREAVLALPTFSMLTPKRRDVVHINESTTYSCLIASGMLGRFGQSFDGARQITAFHIPGDMADLHSAVRPIGVGGLTALCDTTILRVPHIAIRALAARYPAIAEAFWRDCMLDTAVLMQWVVNVGQRDARSRLAHMLCEMAIRSGERGEITRDYAFPVTQNQIGEAAGLTSVHVNRTLMAMADLVALRDGRVRIHNWEELAATGEFDPAYLVADMVPGRRERLLTAA